MCLSRTGENYNVYNSDEHYATKWKPQGYVSALSYTNTTHGEICIHRTIFIVKKKQSPGLFYFVIYVYNHDNIRRDSDLKAGQLWKEQNLDKMHPSPTLTDQFI